jgi:aminopeptidase N
MAHDGDAFNRWEAGQAAARTAMLAMMDGAAPDPFFVDALGPVLNHALGDMAFAANMLSLPLECEIAMAVKVVDPDAIHAARTGLVRAAAAAHAKAFTDLYATLSDGAAFSPDAAAAGKRALRNACLRFLTSADDETAALLAERHYNTATNMTDMIAGLAALSRMTSPRRDRAFTHFYDRFAADPLVLDKWMALQAGSPRADTVAQVRTLMKHAAFDIKNPNRVRALIGAFSGNQLRFHAADGSGYALVGEVIRILDGINAQVAARMAGAFETWKRFDDKRRALIRAELEATLKTPGLSSNMFEVVSKMLA